MMGGLGSVLGAILGGLLSSPVEKYPALFGHGMVRSILEKYPYMLPCGICSLIIGVSAILGHLYLEETLVPVLDEESVSSYGSSPTEGLLDRIPFKAWLAVVCFAGMSFQSVVQRELLAIWAATPAQLGGLGFDSTDIGSLMTFAAIVLLVVQLTLYPPAYRRFGTLFLYRYAFLLYAGIVLGFPAAARLVGTVHEGLLWPALLTCTALRTSSNVFIITSANLMV
ncbi:hypothetical protein DSO57_1027043 [Entomophthora muscae]|uniref:Uncharacterized protein n=1 Tax=Entomophthora muscae TaxID=34485 RepID=A0ACC2UBQ3_9FUNG|nr:hypothetical protein DSO57_1027043 [Entomophthora muscae]